MSNNELHYKNLERELQIIKDSRSYRFALKISFAYNFVRKLKYLKNPVRNFSYRNWSKLSLQDLVPNEKFQRTFWEIPSSTTSWENGVISESFFKEENFFVWMSLLRDPPRLHSKQFQNFAILEAAAAALRNGSVSPRAIGFGVGVEQIPAALGKLGFSVVATDFLDGEIAEEWKNTGQLLERVEDLNSRGILSKEDFESKIIFKNLDMNEIPKEFQGSFDFTWSSCALGHIGGYENGLNFILQSVNLLKPGGLALHTTELDVSNEPDNVAYPNLSLYRLHDLRRVIEILREEGYKVSSLNVPSKWSGRAERFINTEPWGDRPHLRISVFGREVLSVVLRIEKPKIAKTIT